VGAGAYRVARPRDRHLIFVQYPGARPLRQQIDRIRQADRLFQIVGDQQHGDPVAFDQLRDVADNPGADDRVERGEGLVHQQQLRGQRQHLGQRDALALAAAQMTREAAAEPGETEPVEPELGVGQRPMPRPAAKTEAERDIVARRLPR
jgi:hypothetical protein